jgi:microcystin-dependent protein
VSDTFAYTGEIRLLAGDTLPPYWLPCDGRVLPVHEFEVLYSLIGTTYGGDGEGHFGLPDMRGRVPVHPSATVGLGQSGGTERVTLSLAQVPTHTHSIDAGTTDADKLTAAGNMLAATGGTISMYKSDTPDVPLAPDALTPGTGGSAPHENMPPYVALGNYVICVDGAIPPRGED